MAEPVLQPVGLLVTSFSVNDASRPQRRGILENPIRDQWRADWRRIVPDRLAVEIRDASSAGQKVG